MFMTSSCHLVILSLACTSFPENHTCLNLSIIRDFRAVWRKCRKGGLILNTSSGALINSTNWDIMSSIFTASHIVGAAGKLDFIIALFKCKQNEPM